MLNIFLCFKMIKPKELTAKNHTTIGRKTNPWQCASIPIMGTPISISSVINFGKNHTYRTAHTFELTEIFESTRKTGIMESELFDQKVDL